MGVKHLSLASSSVAKNKEPTYHCKSKCDERTYGQYRYRITVLIEIRKIGSVALSGLMLDLGLLKVILEGFFSYF